MSERVSGQPTLAFYRPEDETAYYLQYHYIAANRNAVGEKQLLDDPEDGSEYSAFHQRYHPFFRDIVKKSGYSDVMLIDFDTENIVYSVKKEVDFATNLAHGPYYTSNLAEAVARVKAEPGLGAVYLVDFDSYTPIYKAPVAFFATAIYNGPHIVGILAIQLPDDEINRMMTGSNNWKADGLGASGETYLVGEDRLMRSVSRFLVEAPKRYFADLREAKVSQKTIEAVELFKTSVLLQTVDTLATQAAVSGETGTRLVNDYRGIPVLSAYAPLRIVDLNWVIVSEIDAAEVFQPIRTLQRTLAIAAALIIFVAGLLAVMFSYDFVRPIHMLMTSAERVNAGEQDVVVEQTSKNEFGQFAYTFNEIVQKLSQQNQLIAQKQIENDALMVNILPPAVVQRVRQGDDRIIDHLPQITVMSANLLGVLPLTEHRSTTEVAAMLNELILQFDAAAEHYDVEQRNQLFGEQYFAVCGLSTPHLDHAKRTVDMAREMLSILQRFNAEQGTALGLQIGVHSGSVTASTVGGKKFRYILWGATVKIAVLLSMQAKRNTVMVTEEAHARLVDVYSFTPYHMVDIEDIGRIKAWALALEGRLDAQQIALVQSTFAPLLPVSQEVAALFYRRWFELAPEVRPMFTGDMAEQQRKLMSALQLAIGSLNTPEQLLPSLRKLGREHAAYGAVDGYYETMAEALLWTLKQKLQDGFTPEVEAAWRVAYAFISEVMNEAAAEVTLDMSSGTREAEQGVSLGC